MRYTPAPPCVPACARLNRYGVIRHINFDVVLLEPWEICLHHQLVVDSEGARFQPDLKLPTSTVIVKLDGRPLLQCVMRGGQRTREGNSDLDAARRRAAEELATLPSHVTTLGHADPPYPVRISAALEQFHADVRKKALSGQR